MALFLLAATRRIHVTNLAKFDYFHGSAGSLVGPLSFPFRFSSPHKRNLDRCKVLRTRRASQKVGSRHFVAFRGPAHNADKIPAIPRCAFDIPAYWDAL